MIHNHTIIKNTPQQTDPVGFTLVEVLVVIALLGLLAAMVHPMLGLLDDKERGRITRGKMAEIRRAIVGDPDRFDEYGRRIIGGYVGDMEAWPDLWEPRAELLPSFSGIGWSSPGSMTAGLGQGPDWAMNPNHVFYRPDGHFVDDQWQWYEPYRKLYNDTTNNNDHIGGLETENEGQPRGLWTQYPESLNFDLGTPPTWESPGEDLNKDGRWKGPYLVLPVDNRPDDASHYAEDDAAYDALAPTWTGWQDGDYPDEYRDEKERFRLLQTNGRLADGWERAFRFFITSDPENPSDTEKTVFWIISEGPDHMGTYPNKGEYSGGSWGTPDADDRMGTKYDTSVGKGYNPDDPYNQDNIVMQITSAEWQAVFEERNQRLRQETEKLMEQVRRALIGTATVGEDGFNSGYTGAMCRWPGLFQWEDGSSSWDSLDDTSTPYTKGQPRGLWTDRPNVAETADNLPHPSLKTIGTGFGPGIGWNLPSLPPPPASGADEQLVDGWGRELLFFLDTTNNLLLVLSRGPDGTFDFGATADTLPEGAPDGNPDYLEPDNPTEAVDVTTYTPNDTNGYNADNLVLVVRGSSWQPGWLTLEKLTVENATSGTTKARFVYGVDSSGVVQSSLYVAGTTGTWTVGGGTPPQALRFDDTSTNIACTGTRQLVVWQDTGATADVIDTGEMYTTINFNLYPNNGHEPRTDLTLDTTTFTAAP